MVVSILIPVYNTQDYLSQCLDSIINQTFNNLQIVLIDDGSEDDSFKVMQEYASVDNRIEIYHQDNQGVSCTRNTLLSKSKGDFFIFIDSDDWIEPNMIEFLVNRILQNDADVVTCGIIRDDNIPSIYFKEITLDRYSTIKRFLIHKELQGSLCNKLFKSNLLNETLFDSSIQYGEDALFCWYLFQKIDKLIYTDRQLYHYRMNPNSISHLTFGEKKLTGHRAWEIICKQLVIKYPELLQAGYSHWGLEDSFLLFQASQCHYKKNNKTSLIQKNLKKKLKYIFKNHHISPKEKIFAFFVSFWYGFGSFYNNLYLIKNRIK